MKAEESFDSDIFILETIWFRYFHLRKYFIQIFSDIYRPTIFVLVTLVRGPVVELQGQIKDQQSASLSFYGKCLQSQMCCSSEDFNFVFGPNFKETVLFDKSWDKAKVSKEFRETLPDCCEAAISWRGWGAAPEQPPSPCPAEQNTLKKHVWLSRIHSKYMSGWAEYFQKTCPAEQNT